MKIFITGMVSVALLVVALAFWKCTTPEEFIFPDFARAKADAVVLMARAEKMPPSELPIILRKKDLPESLRSLPIMYVEVRKDHIRLVEIRCPDYVLGVKIWRDGASIPADEKPAPYPNVTYFFVDTSSVSPEHGEWPDQSALPTPV